MNSSKWLLLVNIIKAYIEVLYNIYICIILIQYPTSNNNTYRKYFSLVVGGPLDHIQ